MPAPLTPKNILDEIKARLTRIEQRLNNVLAHTGLSVPAEKVVQCDGSFNVLGDLNVSGTLELPNGSVNNAALVNPVSPLAVYDYIQNFSLSTSLTNIRTTPITVPAGFTKAAVSITVRVFAYNPNTTGGYNGAGGDYLLAEANINGLNGFALPVAVSGSNGSGVNVSPFSTVLTGLTPGGTISLQIAASVNYAAWAANTQNTADVSGMIQWYR
jgi:hypothetical protein